MSEHKDLEKKIRVLIQICREHEQIAKWNGGFVQFIEETHPEIFEEACDHADIVDLCGS
tara:strand:- start:471 stop:647 length:177 start_codon:yes stop_codon:yes gene_type:complete